MKHLYIGHFAVKLLGLCKNHKIITPPQLRSPLPFDWRGAGYHCCLTWLPTPRREELRSLLRLPTPRRENFTSLFRLPTPRRGNLPSLFRLPTPRRENFTSLFRLPTPRRGNLPSLFRLPTPRRGGVLARGAGCKITATKQFIPMLGTKHSHVGNFHHQCLMLANQILLDVSPQAIQRVSTTDLPDPTDPRFLYLCSSISVRWLKSV